MAVPSAMMSSQGFLLHCLAEADFESLTGSNLPDNPRNLVEDVLQQLSELQKSLSQSTAQKSVLERDENVSLGELYFVRVQMHACLLAYMAYMLARHEEALYMKRMVAGANHKVHRTAPVIGTASSSRLLRYHDCKRFLSALESLETQTQQMLLTIQTIKKASLQSGDIKGAHHQGIDHESLLTSTGHLRQRLLSQLEQASHAEAAAYAEDMDTSVPGPHGLDEKAVKQLGYQSRKLTWDSARVHANMMHDMCMAMYHAELALQTCKEDEAAIRDMINRLGSSIGHDGSFLRLQLKVVWYRLNMMQHITQYHPVVLSQCVADLASIQQFINTSAVAVADLQHLRDGIRMAAAALGKDVDSTVLDKDWLWTQIHQPSSNLPASTTHSAQLATPTVQLGDFCDDGETQPDSPKVRTPPRRPTGRYGMDSPCRPSLLTASPHSDDVFCDHKFAVSLLETSATGVQRSLSATIPSRIQSKSLSFPHPEGVGNTDSLLHPVSLPGLSPSRVLFGPVLTSESTAGKNTGRVPARVGSIPVAGSSTSSPASTSADGYPMQHLYRYLENGGADKAQGSRQQAMKDGHSQKQHHVLKGDRSIVTISPIGVSDPGRGAANRLKVPVGIVKNTVAALSDRIRSASSRYMLHGKSRQAVPSASKSKSSSRPSAPGIVARPGLKVGSSVSKPQERSSTTTAAMNYSRPSRATPLSLPSNQIDGNNDVYQSDSDNEESSWADFGSTLDAGLYIPQVPVGLYEARRAPASSMLGTARSARPRSHSPVPRPTIPATPVSPARSVSEFHPFDQRGAAGRANMQTGRFPYHEHHLEQQHQVDQGSEGRLRTVSSSDVSTSESFQFHLMNQSEMPAKQAILQQQQGAAVRAPYESKQRHKRQVVPDIVPLTALQIAKSKVVGRSPQAVYPDSRSSHIDSSCSVSPPSSASSDTDGVTVESLCGVTGIPNSTHPSGNNITAGNAATGNTHDRVDGGGGGPASVPGQAGGGCGPVVADHVQGHDNKQSYGDDDRCVVQDLDEQVKHKHVTLTKRRSLPTGVLPMPRLHSSDAVRDSPVYDLTAQLSDMGRSYVLDVSTDPVQHTTTTSTRYPMKSMIPQSSSVRRATGSVAGQNIKGSHIPNVPRVDKNSASRCSAGMSQHTKQASSVSAARGGAKHRVAPEPGTRGSRTSVRSVSKMDVDISVEVCDASFSTPGRSVPSSKSRIPGSVVSGSHKQALKAQRPAQPSSGSFQSSAVEVRTGTGGNEVQQVDKKTYTTPIMPADSPASPHGTTAFSAAPGNAVVPHLPHVLRDHHEVRDPHEGDKAGVDVQGQQERFKMYAGLEWQMATRGTDGPASPTSASGSAHHYGGGNDHIKDNTLDHDLENTLADSSECEWPAEGQWYSSEDERRAAAMQLVASGPLNSQRPDHDLVRTSIQAVSFDADAALSSHQFGILCEDDRNLGDGDGGAGGGVDDDDGDHVWVEALDSEQEEQFEGVLIRHLSHHRMEAGTPMSGASQAVFNTSHDHHHDGTEQQQHQEQVKLSSVPSLGLSQPHHQHSVHQHSGRNTVHEAEVMKDQGDGGRYPEDWHFKMRVMWRGLTSSKPKELIREHARLAQEKRMQDRYRVMSGRTVKKAMNQDGDNECASPRLRCRMFPCACV